MGSKVSTTAVGAHASPVTHGGVTMATERYRYSSDAEPLSKTTATLPVGNSLTSEYAWCSVGGVTLHYSVGVSMLHCVRGLFVIVGVNSPP